MRIIGLVMLFCRIRHLPRYAPRCYGSLRPREGQLQREAGRIPTRTGAARTGQGVGYFIQEKGSDALGVTTMIGLDGTWVGANKNSSYFGASVEPGEINVCANVQSHRGHPVSLVHFTAEVGKVYYSMRESFTEKQPTRIVFCCGRQRPGQVSDCLLSAERFNSQEVTYVLWMRGGISVI